MNDQVNYHTCIAPALFSESIIWLCDLAQLEMIPVVADEAEDLLQFKVFFLTLHSQVIQGKMDHIHPANERQSIKKLFEKKERLVSRNVEVI